MKKLSVLCVALCLALGACSSSPIKGDLYKNDHDRYIKNIVVKEKSEYGITYEYKDVRIDELASAAAKYCNQLGKKAMLISTSLYHNNKMRSAFMCEVLQ